MNSNIEYEEYLNYEANKKIIDNIINHRKEKIRKDKNLSELFSNDYQYIFEKKNNINKNKDQIKKLEEISKSPYFGKMILKKDNKEKAIYIGYNKVTDSEENIIVHGWQAPICRIFSTNETTIKNYNYMIELKRDIFIENKKFKSAFDRYNSSTYFSNEISDGYLNEILNRQKNEKKIVDIVKSIQKKQNDIIRLDKDTNILCQGVAGSGKTMIIAHRISYLIYNYDNITPDRYLFITPNDNFKNELQELNKTLSIEGIKYKTIYDFYKEKINCFLKKGMGENLRINYIISDDDVDLKKQYSKDYANSRLDLVKNRINEVLIDIFKINNIIFDSQKSIKENIAYISKVNKDNFKIYKFYFDSLDEKIDRIIYNIDLIDISKVQMKFENEYENCIVTYKKLRDKYKIVKGNDLNSLFDLLDKIIDNYEENIIPNLDKKILMLWRKIIILISYLIKEDVISAWIQQRILSIKELLVLAETLIKKSNFKNYNIFKENGRKLLKLQNEKIFFKALLKNLYPHKYHISKINEEKFCKNDVFIILYIINALGLYKENNYSFIFFDEAQDYNDEEIKLVCELEQHPIINIFGDLRQNIFENVIVRNSWQSLLKSINTIKYFELNENYRNPKCIVKYCNKYLKTNMNALGIDSGQIKIINNIDFEGLKLLALNNDCIIICNDEQLSNKLKLNEIQVYNLLEIKGREYPNVIVIDSNFKNNEKYVAYTRCKNNLFIVNSVY